MHRRRGEKPCDACRIAWNAYRAEHRSISPGMYAVERERNSARNRAVWRLARLYREEFLALYFDERTKSLTGQEAS